MCRAALISAAAAIWFIYFLRWKKKKTALKNVFLVQGQEDVVCWGTLCCWMRDVGRSGLKTRPTSAFLSCREGSEVKWDEMMRWTLNAQWVRYCSETTWMHVWSVNAALQLSADFSGLLPLTLDEAHANVAFDSITGRLTTYNRKNHIVKTAVVIWLLLIEARLNPSRTSVSPQSPLNIQFYHVHTQSKLSFQNKSINTLNS